MFYGILGPKSGSPGFKSDVLYTVRNINHIEEDVDF